MKYQPFLCWIVMCAAAMHLVGCGREYRDPPSQQANRPVGFAPEGRPPHTDRREFDRDSMGGEGGAHRPPPHDGRHPGGPPPHQGGMPPAGPPHHHGPGHPGIGAPPGHPPHGGSAGAPFEHDRFGFEADPEMHKLITADADLSERTQELAQQCRDAPSEERAELEKQLRELIDQHFDSRQARRELQLQRLQAELKKLGDAIERRNAARKDIVERRLAELIGVQSELEF